MSTAVAAPNLHDYLESVGGSDVLTFDTDEEAGKAAHELRKQGWAEVSITASYNKVHMKCSSPP